MEMSSQMLAERLKAEGDAALAFFRGLDAALWNTALYGGRENWRLRDLLAHLITAEQGFLELLQDVAAGGKGAPADFDIDAYNHHAVETLKDVDIDVLLGQFAMVRERTAAVVAGLNAAQLEHQGRHPHLGESRLEEMVRLIYHHDNLHLRDVRRALRSAGSSAVGDGLSGSPDAAPGGSA